MIKLHQLASAHAPSATLGFVTGQLAAHLNRVHSAMSKWQFYAGPSDACQSCNVQLADRTKLYCSE